MNEPVQRIFSNAPWEKVVGYCRVIRMGSMVAVTGTTSINEQGEVILENDAFGQTQRSLQLIERYLSELGLSRRNIIRTRMFVTDIDRWEEYGKAHGEFFRDCPPATSMLEVKRLIDPKMLIEIEADAVINELGTS